MYPAFRTLNGPRGEHATQRESADHTAWRTTGTEGWHVSGSFEGKSHRTLCGRFSLTAAVLRSSFVALLAASDRSTARYSVLFYKGYMGRVILDDQILLQLVPPVITSVITLCEVDSLAVRASGSEGEDAKVRRGRWTGNVQRSACTTLHPWYDFLAQSSGLKDVGLGGLEIRQPSFHALHFAFVFVCFWVTS